MPEIAIKSRRTITPEGEREATVLLQNGLIADVLPYNAQVDCSLLDVQDQALMPGVIDPHIHINEPGRTDWEGFNTATQAALHGGLTALVDMPLNSAPVTTTVANFREKLEAAKNQLHTNCGFWGGIVPGNSAEVEPLIEAGVLGFKAFLTHSGIDDFPNATEEDLRKVMPILAKYQLPLLVHCELSEENDDWKKNDTRSYQNYLSSRPKSWEDEAIGMMIRLCEEFNCPTHIVHLSSANSIKPIAEAKAKGLPLTVETGQHYLFFNAEDIPDAHPEFKCAPPIREKANNDQLWEALRSGIIDFVATDHSPAPPELKQLETGDFSTAWGGISSLQLALPVLWTAALKRGFNLTDLTKWLCANPAKLIGQSKRKGKIANGFDADLIVVDTDKKFTVTKELIRHRHKMSPYLGLELQGQVRHTFLKGQEVFRFPSTTNLNQGEIITRSHV
jgi:allantoinase